MGVTSKQFQSEECQSNLEGIFVIFLDFDKVVIPKEDSYVHFNKSFTKRIEYQLEHHIPPPATRVLYCNDTNIIESSFIVFEIVFGPGALGIRLRSRYEVLYDGEGEMKCAYLDSVDDSDMTITGPGKRVPLLKREPVILAVNGKNMIGKDHKEVQAVIKEASRPLLLRCQSYILTGEEHDIKDHVPSCSSSGTDSTPLPSMSTSTKDADDLVIAFSESMEERSSSVGTFIWSPVLSTPSEYGHGRAYRPYNVISPNMSVNSECDSGHSIEDDTPQSEMADFMEAVRISFMMEFCRLIGHYKLCFRTGLVNGAEMKEILDKKLFLQSVDEDDQQFVKKLYKTQLFRHFIEDAFEYEDNYEINLFNDCISIMHGMGDYAEAYIQDQLLPSNWKLVSVDVPIPTADGLPERWKEIDMMRSVDCFPRLQEEFYGMRERRMKSNCFEKAGKTIVPEDMKAMTKEYKLRCAK